MVHRIYWCRKFFIGNKRYGCLSVSGSYVSGTGERLLYCQVGERSQLN